MGPIQLIPHHGSGWEQRKLPERLRATYKRPHGVRYLFGAYDVHSDRLHGRLRERKDAGEVLAFFRQIRMRYDPRLRIYLVMDNLSTHKTEAIWEWAEKANVELVFTPTYGSFLNRIESHFWAIGEFVVKNADYLRLGRIRQGNGRAHPLPQRAPPRPTTPPGRAPTADRRMSNRVTGATLTDHPLAAELPTSFTRSSLATGSH
jgi:hypothetical protein